MNLTFGLEELEQKLKLEDATDKGRMSTPSSPKDEDVPENISFVEGNEDGVSTSFYQPQSSPLTASTSVFRNSPALAEYPSRMRNAASGLYNHMMYGKWRQKSMDFLRGSEEPVRCENSIIWLLGRSYCITERDQGDYLNFLADFRSRIWLSYREGFPALPNSHKVSDCGWGCMLRCAQMMTAQALVLQTLGRDWRLSSSWACRELEPIIRLFEDCEKAPLSIHNLLRFAAKRCNAIEMHDELSLSIFRKTDDSTVAGQWFTPSGAVSLLRDAVDFAAEVPNMKIHLSTDMNVAIDELMKLSDNWTHSVLLVVSIRLGTKHINKTYYSQLKSLFSIEQCCGVIGGRPKRAFYFVGCENDRLYYLDPHTVQKYQPLDDDRDSAERQRECCASGSCQINHKQSVGLSSSPKKESKGRRKSRSRRSSDAAAEGSIESTEEKWMSFHSLKAPSLPLDEVDPSCAVGFMFKSAIDLHSCIQDLRLANVIEYRPATESQDSENSEKSVMRTPFFTIVENRDCLLINNQRSKRMEISTPPRVIDEDGFEVV